MPIEFPCTACGQLVRTPDSAAGKKGKCPHCGTIAQIPLASPGVRSQESGVRGQRTEDRGQRTAASTPPAGGAVISFPCGSCGQTVRTPMSAAGKKGKCPHCQAVVQIPGGASPAPTPVPAAPKPAAATAGLMPLAPLPSQQPKAAAPRPAQPGPWKSSSAPTKPNPPAAAEEIEELPTLTPIDSPPGLVPLGPAVGGLTPFGPPQSVAGGLSPFGGGGDPLAGLTPLNVSNQTLRPVSAPNPLGTSPAGFGSVPNPYAAPGGGYSAGYGGVSDAGRKGLPWERNADMDNFQDTAMLILGEPSNAFMQMRRSGGVMNSMAFWIIAAIISQVASIVYLTILGAIGLAIANAPGEAYAGLALYMAIQLVGGVVFMLILAPVGAFIGAGFWHVILLMFGCARGGFEATFRAVCFVGGAVILLNVIPIIGPLIGMFYGIALMIQAFTHAHEVSGGRVTAAVLTVYGLLCCCVSPFIIFSLMGFLSNLAAGGPF